MKIYENGSRVKIQFYEMDRALKKIIRYDSTLIQNARMGSMLNEK